MDVVATDLPELDITDAAAVNRFVTVQDPDVVFNTAAWTAVDDAESKPEQTSAINVTGAENIARVCQGSAIPMVHYSTDYVFDGTKTAAYVESDTPNPVSVYGQSKLDSELAVVAGCDKHLVLRTSWVFSASGNNFVKTMLRLAQERSELNIVNDQVGKPTSAMELARLSLEAVRRGGSDWGIYHVAQPPAVSWYEFAQAIFAKARGSGTTLHVEQVNPIKSHEFHTAAERPANSELDCGKFENTFEVRIADWHDALDAVIGELHRGGFFA